MSEIAKIQKIDFSAWYEALPEAQKTAYAARAKTTRNYIESHLLAPYKIPRAESMNNLASASEEFTVAQLAAWFYETTLARREVQQPGRMQ